MALSEAIIKRNKKRRSNSATGRNILGSNSRANNMYKIRQSSGASVGDKSPYPKEKATSSSTEDKLGHPKRKETKTSKNITVTRTGLRTNILPKKDKVDKKSKKTTTSKKTSGGTGLRANTPPKVKETTKYKMVTAPHRNPTNKKVKVVDRPVKPRKKIMVNSARGFKGGGKIYNVDNSGQDLINKMYGGKIKY